MNNADVQKQYPVAYAALPAEWYKCDSYLKFYVCYDILYAEYWLGGEYCWDAVNGHWYETGYQERVGW